MTFPPTETTPCLWEKISNAGVIPIEMSKSHETAHKTKGKINLKASRDDHVPV